MNATQARQEAEKQKDRRSDTAHLMKHVKVTIEEAVKRGEFSIKSPLKGLRTPVSPEQEHAVYAALHAEGYEVKVGLGGKHIDPRARDKVEVSW